MPDRPLPGQSGSDPQLLLSFALEALQNLPPRSVPHETADLFRLYIRQADEAISRANSGHSAATNPVRRRSGGDIV